MALAKYDNYSVTIYDIHGIHPVVNHLMVHFVSNFHCQSICIALNGQQTKKLKIYSKKYTKINFAKNVMTMRNEGNLFLDWLLLVVTFRQLPETSAESLKVKSAHGRTVQFQNFGSPVGSNGRFG